MVTQDDTAPMEDRDEAAAQLMDIAENGDPDAQYLTGRLYRDGPVLIPDSVEAGYWFEQSARQGVVAAHGVTLILKAVRFPSVSKWR